MKRVCTRVWVLAQLRQQHRSHGAKGTLLIGIRTIGWRNDEIPIEEIFGRVGGPVNRSHRESCKHRGYLPFYTKSAMIRFACGSVRHLSLTQFGRRQVRLAVTLRAPGTTLTRLQNNY